jgi:hypothetical protein
VRNEEKSENQMCKLFIHKTNNTSSCKPGKHLNAAQCSDQWLTKQYDQEEGGQLQALLPQREISRFTRFLPIFSTILCIITITAML